MTREAYTPSRWCIKILLRYATAWLAKKRLSHRGASEHSLWWDFVHRWPREIHAWVDDFVAKTKSVTQRRKRREDAIEFVRLLIFLDAHNHELTLFLT